VRVTKNKVAPPFREAEFDIMYNEGISKAGDVLDIATELEIITKRGRSLRLGTRGWGRGARTPKNSSTRIASFWRRSKDRFARMPPRRLDDPAGQQCHAAGRKQ